MTSVYLSKCVKKLYANEYAFGSEVFRLAFGLLFFLVGVKKLRMGYTGFAEAIVAGDGYLANEIPYLFLYVYGLALPAAELAAGIALLANKYVREAYAGIALMYLTFIFGQQYDGETGKVGTEYLPALVALTIGVFMREKAKN